MFRDTASESETPQLVRARFEDDSFIQITIQGKRDWGGDRVSSKTSEISKDVTLPIDSKINTVVQVPADAKGDNEYLMVIPPPKNARSDAVYCKRVPPPSYHELEDLKEKGLLISI